MIKELKVPELGENIESADVTNVLVSVGDIIDINTPVIEIETDKAAVEVPSDISGVVMELKVEQGGKVKTGDIILLVDISATNSDDKKSIKNESSELTLNKSENLSEKIQEEIIVSKGLAEFKVPDLGENISAAAVTAVMVKVGDNIELGASVIEIETDKAAVEVPSEVSGIVKEVKINVGDSVKTGDVLIVVELTDSEVIKQNQTKTPVKSEREISENDQKVKPIVNEVKTEKSKTGIEKEPFISRDEMPKKIVPAAPHIRKFAREIGVDIINVTGTGPGGRISIEDVKAYSKKLNESLQSGTLSLSQAGFGVKPEKLPDFSQYGNIEITPMSNVRKKTAEHLSYAWSVIPHVTQFDKADITDLENFRKQFGKIVEKSGGKLTVTSILLKIISKALIKFPQFNSSINMETKEIIYKNYYNIGVAVDTDRGLLVPVIKDVDKKSVTKLSVELSEISVKARDKKLSLEDMQGGNFTISNLGGIGGTYFTPIVNSPEVAILGVSRGAYEPVFENGTFIPRLKLPLSLSYDHRIIDGADAIRFLRWIIDSMENPFLTLLED